MTDSHNTRSDYYVYQYTRDGIPVYIGKGCGKRWLRHASATGHNPRLHRMIAKDQREGASRMAREKVAEGLTEAEAFDIEVFLISYYGRAPNGTLVNMTDGGEGASNRCPEVQARMSVAVRQTLLGHAVSQETREKIRAALAGRPRDPEAIAKATAANKGRKRTPEQRARFSLAQMGNKNNVGRVFPEETRAKIRTAQLGRKMLPEQVAKAAAANTGKKRTPEQRAAMSAVRKGKPCSEAAKIACSLRHKGVPKSAEQREKQRLAMTGRKRSPEAEAKRLESYRRAVERRNAAKAAEQPDLFT